MEYYSALKKLIHATTRINFEDIMLSKISQSQKTNTIWFYLDEVPSQIHRDRKYDGGCQGLGGQGGEVRSYYLMYIEFQFCKMKSSGNWSH